MIFKEYSLKYLPITFDGSIPFVDQPSVFGIL